MAEGPANRRARHGGDSRRGRTAAILLPQAPVSVIMRWLKGSTARKANQRLGRTGQPFWQDESWDHYVRSARQLDRLTAYVEQNPVSAGLVESMELWRW